MCTSTWTPFFSIHFQLSCAQSPNLTWSPCLLDLTPCYFFMWGFVKSRVYVTRSANIPELKGRIRRVVKSPSRCARKSRWHTASVSRKWLKTTGSHRGVKLSWKWVENDGGHVEVYNLAKSEWETMGGSCQGAQLNWKWMKNDGGSCQGAQLNGKTMRNDKKHVEVHNWAKSEWICLKVGRI